MKIALCFWGLTRSLKYTIDSIEKYILEPLKKAGIEYDIFLHTYYFKGKYTNYHGKEYDIKLDFDDYKLLNPDYIQIDDQDEFRKNTDFTKYYFNGKKKSGYNIETYHNYICALNSMYKVTQLVKNTKIQYDNIFFIRPDCKYLREFNTRWFILSKKIKVLIPRFAKSGGLNDRMFIGNYNQGIVLGESINYLEEYVKNNLFKAELFRKWVIYKYVFPNTRPLVKMIDYSFQRVRANGEIAHLDRNLNGY